MTAYRIAIYPGDGIGIEVTDQAVRVMEKAAENGGFRVDMTRIPWGCDYQQQHGQVAPGDFLDVLKPFDAIYLGAIGDPRRLPDHVTLRPLVQIRQRFDQYACVRPARLLKGVRSPLATPGTIDMVVIRENSEGEYVPVGGRVKPQMPDEVAVQTAVHTRRGVERILRFGFDLARQRRRQLTMVTKSNAMAYSMVMWDEVLEALRPEYPDVEARRQHVDSVAMDFVRRPGMFDVVVASNLFGDILTDLAGAIVGGLGLAPSANINPQRAFPSMFEPVHGSAPDIAGQGIANPVAAILSAANLLDWVGQAGAAARITAAVEDALAAGHATADLGGRLNTAQMTDRVLERLA
jgi:tartrate dehydrogenase/decarboxylase/D-malate dehydrogenase